MIRIDFQKNCGAVKPLHGVNNSPMRLNGTQPEFQAAGIPFVRTHDPAVTCSVIYPSFIRHSGRTCWRIMINIKPVINAKVACFS